VPVVRRSGRARLLAFQAPLAVGHHAAALDAVRRARRIEAGPDASRLALAEAEALFGLLRYRDALGLAERALARASRDRDVAARWHLVRGHALWMMGRVSPGWAEVRRAADQPEVVPLTRARALTLLGRFAWKEQDIERALIHVSSAQEIYASCGYHEGLVEALECEVGVLRDRGRLDLAREAADRRVEIASRTTRKDLLARARADRGAILTILGRWEAARRDVEAAAELFREVEDPREFTVAGVYRAAVDLATGNLVAARRALTKAREVHGAERSNPRSLADCLLVVADLHLAAAEPDAACEAAAEALRLFGIVRDRGGECRARVRRCHALVTLGRVEEAIREARRAVRLGAPSTTHLQATAYLALGRALFRVRLTEAASAFDQALALAEGRAELACAARLGKALARGSRFDDREVRAALAGLEAWGDRRFLAYGLGDVRRVLGSAPSAAPVTASAPDRSAATSSGLDGATARAITDVALALEAEGAPVERWAAAMVALRPILRWRRAALGPQPAWALREDLDAPVPLDASDPASRLVSSADAPVVVDLQSHPEFKDDPLRLLHRLRGAAVVPVRDGLALYVDTPEDTPLPGTRPLEVLVQVARLLAARLPVPEPEQAGDSGRALPGLLGRCEAMRRLAEEVSRVAPADSAVHIYGETGTGKELVARAVHARSRRAGGPFVAVNASCLGDDLFEAEMFGHVKGAFTGAVLDREGYVAASDRGTLFIDEVADLTPRAQAKLLRFLQDGEYRRVGEPRPRRADVRILSAANVDLEQRVREGRFRQDLLFRLRPIVLALPPVRERGGDLLILARHFLQAAAASVERPAPELPAEVARCLERYPWPGNVRELESEMHRLVLLSAGGGLRAEHLSPKVRGSGARPATTPLREAVLGFERDYVESALARLGGSRARTAQALGITRQALVSKIRRLGL
jgi:DNA-binding NtrC family response regulator/tetratricopeptide (TPR) repeat protein